METSPATRAYKDFFPSHGDQYQHHDQVVLGFNASIVDLVEFQANVEVTSDTESEEEGGFIETAQEITDVHGDFEFNRTSSSRWVS